MRDYQRQQAIDQQDLADRTAEIYDQFPEFARIDGEIAAASTACARRILADEAASVDALRKELSALSKQKTQLLSEAGYPADYLSPRYKCPDCQDTGYIGTQKCHCFRQAAIDLLYTQSNLKEILQTENFSAFSLDYYSEQMPDSVTGLTARQTAERALQECRRFVETFDEQFENLFLYGDTGLGKTFLSHCIAKELLERTHSVIYFSSFRLFELFADSAFGRSDSSQDEMEQHIFDCDLLIIDDLGTELVNSFVSSELFHVLNERILRRKSTLISTNLSLATFADTYSERIFSRISSNYRMLKLIGDDIRLLKKMRETKISPVRS
jgi:DNA replication protein DnaC